MNTRTIYLFTMHLAGDFQQAPIIVCLPRFPTSRQEVVEALTDRFSQISDTIEEEAREMFSAVLAGFPVGPELMRQVVSADVANNWPSVEHQHNGALYSFQALEIPA